MAARLMQRLAGGREKKTSAISGASRNKHSLTRRESVGLAQAVGAKTVPHRRRIPIILRSARVTPDCERFYGATSFASGRWRKAGFPASPRSLGHL